MKTAPLDPLARRVVRALYELAELDCPASAGLLARALDTRAADVARVLLVLEARGLASADRARLTLSGLALAARQPGLALSRETLCAAPGPCARVAPHPRARSRNLPSARAPVAAFFLRSPDRALRRRTLAG